MVKQYEEICFNFRCKLHVMICLQGHCLINNSFSNSHVQQLLFQTVSLRSNMLLCVFLFLSLSTKVFGQTFHGGDCGSNRVPDRPALETLNVKAHTYCSLACRHRPQCQGYALAEDTDAAGLLECR